MIILTKENTMAKATKAKGTGKISLAPRVKKPKTARKPMILDEKYTGAEPVWEGWEKWSIERFRKEQHRGFYYYNYHNAPRDLIPNVIKWMETNGYAKDEIRNFKETPDWATTSTMGSLATMLLRGMPTKHPNSEDRDNAEWLREKIGELIAKGKELAESKKKEEKRTSGTVQPSIQDRIRSSAHVIAEDIDAWLEGFIKDPNAFDPKGFNVVNHFKSREANQAHARVIRESYAERKAEYELLVNPGKTKDEQLIEGYKTYTKGQQRNMLAALTEIVAACDMLLQTAKVARKVRAKKAPSKEKLVAKIKYKATDDRYKLVSIKPEDALQSLELWVFNSKTRKLGCYVATDLASLSVKGTTIINFDESKSVAKTVRKPEEFLRDVKSLPKTKMRKLYESINSVETKLNGRINADMLLLKAYN
jgi:hypothetical protein